MHRFMYHVTANNIFLFVTVCHILLYSTVLLVDWVLFHSSLHSPAPALLQSGPLYIYLFHTPPVVTLFILHFSCWYPVANPLLLSCLSCLEPVRSFSGNLFYSLAFFVLNAPKSSKVWNIIAFIVYIANICKKKKKRNVLEETCRNQVDQFHLL